MEGVTTALVGFIFVCILFPKLVRHRPPFYMAFVGVALILLFAALGLMIGGTFATFAMVIVMLLNLVAFVLLVLATGGLSLGELTGEIAGAFESMRGSGPAKTTIVPLSGQGKASTETAPKPTDEEGRTVYVIDGGTSAPQQPKKQDTGPIPLE